MSCTSSRTRGRTIVLACNLRRQHTLTWNIYRRPDDNATGNPRAAFERPFSPHLLPWPTQAKGIIKSGGNKMRPYLQVVKKIITDRKGEIQVSLLLNVTDVV